MKAENEEFLEVAKTVIYLKWQMLWPLCSTYAATYSGGIQYKIEDVFNGIQRSNEQLFYHKDGKGAQRVNYIEPLFSIVL